MPHDLSTDVSDASLTITRRMFQDVPEDRVRELFCAYALDQALGWDNQEAVRSAINAGVIGKWNALDAHALRGAVGATLFNMEHREDSLHDRAMMQALRVLLYVTDVETGCYKPGEGKTE